MAADLRSRIQRGDLAALTDPALPLHLLAELEARWWREGRLACCAKLYKSLAQALTGAQVANVLEAWAPAWRANLHATGLAELRLLPIASERRLTRVVASVLHVPGMPWGAARLDLYRRLRALLPSAPPEIDAALAILERYAG